MSADERPKGPVVRQIPPGDDKERLVCLDCGFVNYDNPKVVVGAVVTVGDKFLLCKRAIEPRPGFWTIPAGYLEQHEDTLDGALREAREEAGADITIDALLAVYSIRRLSQVQLIYRATLKRAVFQRDARASRRGSSRGTKSRGASWHFRACTGSATAPSRCCGASCVCAVCESAWADG